MPEELRVDAAADLFEGASEHQRRHPRGELDHVDALPHLAAGLVQGFPVLVDDDLGKRLEVPLEQMLKPEHETSALHDRRVRPRFRRLGGGARGYVDLLRVGERNLGDPLARRGSTRASSAPSTAVRRPAITFSNTVDPIRRFYGRELARAARRSRSSA